MKILEIISILIAIISFLIAIFTAHRFKLLKSKLKKAVFIKESNEAIYLEGFNGKIIDKQIKINIK